MYNGGFLHANEYIQTKKWYSNGKPLVEENSFVVMQTKFSNLDCDLEDEKLKMF